MTRLVNAEGPILDQILRTTYEIWHEDLSRAAYGRFYAAQLATAWGRGRVRTLALVDGDEVLASAKLYLFDATLDTRPIRVAGIGAVFTPPARRGRGAARALLDQVLERAAADAADLALLFSEIGPDYYARLGFAAIATTDRRLRVAESERHGAPATMVRGGEDRDLADIADLVHFSIVRKRLLAGLGSAGVRQLHFFIAEEGASAAAYVVVSVRGHEAAPGGVVWTIEDAGDRDPTGARVGAIMQVLIARDPAEKRPSISAWLPVGFLPPQISIIAEQPSAEVMMVRPLTAAGTPSTPLTEADILYWHGDLF
jgi:predicted N-acetyltransferase YhbS